MHHVQRLTRDLGTLLAQSVEPELQRAGVKEEVAPVAVELR